MGGVINVLPLTLGACALIREGISLALAAKALRANPRLAISGVRCTRGAARSDPDAAIDSLTLPSADAYCRRL